MVASELDNRRRAIVAVWGVDRTMLFQPPLPPQYAKLTEDEMGLAIAE